MTSGDEEFDREDREESEEGMSQSEYTAAENDLRVNPYCETGDCTAKTEDPAEEAWIKLMSAVPRANQSENISAARPNAKLPPEFGTIKAMVQSIRPQPEADYAIDTIRDKWIEFRDSSVRSPVS